MRITSAPPLGAIALTLAFLGLAAPAVAAGPLNGELPSLRQLATGDPGGPGGTPAAARTGVPGTGRYTFLLRLATDPTTDAFAAARTNGLPAARSAARAQLSRVSTAQAKVVAALPRNSPVLYRTHSVLAGVAVRTDVRNVDALRDLPGVTAVYPVAPKSYDNSYAVPLQGAPQAWEGRGDLGQNTSIAIIDTGIDYTHANFGGPGTVAAYDEAAEHEGEDADPSLYPNDKVVGGTDLVGDAYDADPDDETYSPVPHPDSNPLDCAGHGSHVAGIAAGLGEDEDGSTYTGDYDTTTPFNTMRIGPGMAPAAKLYAYRVFGCNGSSDVITEAIDRASDPNGDGDPSDHVDVINMSLGSTFGSAQDGDSVAADAAVDLGITLAVSSGNDGDYTDIAGSPGTASKVITVANSEDASNVIDGADVTIGTTPHTFGVTRGELYDWSGPDLVGDVVRAPSGNRTACDAYAPGTFTGKVVLVEWDDDAVNTGGECGSIQRGTNLADAGAIGFIFANTHETFAAGINGSADIPGVLMTKSGGDAIRTALDADTAVIVDGTSTNSVTQPLFLEDDDKVNVSSSRGIHAAGNVKPDVTAVGTSVFSTAVGTGIDGISLTGTSMAAPMVAGLAALVRSAHPNWTPNQVKADIMNTAGQDLYVNGSLDPSSPMFAPARVGAGRIKADDALSNDVLAYNADDDGTVSVSFGPVEVTGPTTLTKRIRVENTSLSSLTYHATYDAITTVPGVVYTVSPSTVALAPRASATVTVTLSVTDPSQLTKAVDPTIGRMSSQEDIPRETLAEASGRVVLTPTASGRPTLRVPVYSAPRPASTMTQADTLQLSGGGDDQTAPLPLTGGDVGRDGANGTAGGDSDGDGISSITAGFELQATSGLSPKCSATITTGCYELPEERAADLHYVGVSSDYPQYADDDPSDAEAYFAISTHGAWSIPSDRAVIRIDIDVDGDHTPDLYLYNARSGSDDVFVSELYDPEHGVIDDRAIDGRLGDVDAALYDSDTMILPVSLEALAAYGIAPEHPRISYGVEGYTNTSGQAIDQIGVDPDRVATTLLNPLTVDLFHPGVRVTDDAGEGPLLYDQDGDAPTVHRNPSTYRADGGQGLLMLHLHNEVGAKAQVVSLHGQPQAITFTSTPPVPAPRGGTYALSATGGGSSAPVVFSSATPDSCTVDGATVTFVATGTCTVDADQPGDDDHDPAPTASQTITVVRVGQAQTVAFTSVVPPDTAIPGRAYPLTATGGGSSAPVVFSSATPDSCTVDGATVIFVAAGTCTLHADQAGDKDHDAAPTAVQSIAVHRVETVTTVSVGPSTLLAVIAPTEPGLADISGTVTFSVDGAPVGVATVSGGAASLPYRAPTGATRHITAAYSGDRAFVPSAASVDRADPRITARVSSARAKTRYGWYRSPVTVTFTCTTSGAPLATACPAKATLSRGAAKQSVSRGVTATDGGGATAAVAGLNIDRVRPTVRITGIRKRATYRGKVPAAHCVARDTLSKVASCRVTRKRKGQTIRFTAKGTDKAGNVRSVTVTVRT